MVAADSHAFTRRIVLILVGLGVRIFTQCHALPLGDQDQDMTSEAESLHLFGRPQQETLAPRQSQQHLGSLQERGCPPGLWCKRNQEPEKERELGVRPEEKDEFKDQNNSDDQGAIIDCLPGATCKKTQSIETQIETGRLCPFGLWCQNDGQNGRDSEGKLDDSYPDEEKLQKRKNLRSAISANIRGDNDETQDDESDCPPGLWCKRDGRKRETADQTLQTNCPMGLWCYQTRSRGLHDLTVIPECPAGLWCMKHRVKPSCLLSPNSPWCKVRVYIDTVGARTEKRRETTPDCPPGLWC